MKIEEVLGWTSDQCKSFSDEAFLENFRDALMVTRPEFAPKPKTISHGPAPVVQTKQFAAKIEQLKALGMDISVDDFRKKGKRR